MFGKIFSKIKCFVFIRAFINFMQNDGLEYAGYLAFLSIFTIFPLFIVIVASMSMVYETSIGVEIISKALKMIPPYAEGVFKKPIEDILKNPAPNIFSLIMASAIWTVTSALETMRKIFNRIYHVKEPPFFIITRVLSMAQFCCAIALMLAIIAVFAVVPDLVDLIKKELGIHITHVDLDMFYINDISMFIALILVVGGLYKTLTNTAINFKATLPGATFTVIAWILSAKSLAYYINNFSKLDLIYGSLAGIIITLLFFYFISAVLLYGAELNFMLTRPAKKSVFQNNRK